MWDKTEMRCYWTWRSGGLANVLDVQSLLFFIKENWIYAMTRHHAEPNINILLTRNLPFDYDVRKCSHPLMIPLHCLWPKLNNRTRGQFECDVIWFCFVLFSFRLFTCTVRLLFHGLLTFSNCEYKTGWLQN